MSSGDNMSLWGDVSQIRDSLFLHEPLKKFGVCHAIREKDRIS
jgi:hypothetical protein